MYINKIQNTNVKLNTISFLINIHALQPDDVRAALTRRFGINLNYLIEGGFDAEKDVLVELIELEELTRKNELLMVKNSSSQVTPMQQSTQPRQQQRSQQDTFTGTLPSLQNQRTADMKLPAANSTSVNGDRERLRHLENYVQATFDSSLQHIAQTQIRATQILAELKDSERKNELLMVKISSLEARNHSLTELNNELKKEVHLLKELQSLTADKIDAL